MLRVLGMLIISYMLPQNWTTFQTAVSLTWLYKIAFEKKIDTVIMEKDITIIWWKYRHHSHRLFSSHEIHKHFKTIFLDNISIHQKNNRTFPPNREDLFESFHTIVSWFTEQYRHLSKTAHSKHPLNPTVPTIISIVTERFYHPICVYCITLYFHNAH
jgi:hypothetical protein